MQKKAFSLIELLIVIIIMGVIYTLGVSNFQRLSDESEKLTLLNLKEHLNSFPHTKSVKVLCLDNCSACDILVDGVKRETVEDFLDESVKIYRYEFIYGFIEADKEVYFNIDEVEENVCFSYEVDKRGVGEQVLVEFKNSFYDFSNYFNKTAVYSSLEAALESRENLRREVMR